MAWILPASTVMGRYRFSLEFEISLFRRKDSPEPPSPYVLLSALDPFIRGRRLVPLCCAFVNVMDGLAEVGKLGGQPSFIYCGCAGAKWSVMTGKRTREDPRHHHYHQLCAQEDQSRKEE